MVEAHSDYLFSLDELMVCVSKHTVSKISKSLKPMTLAGQKRKQETAYFFHNARPISKIAQDLAKNKGDEVIAVLFRDADHTRSSKRGEWQYKWNSMINGFSYEGFGSGVPMLPNPKSESWLLCALKNPQPYQDCDRIEGELGNDDSPNCLKVQLEQVLGQSPNAVMLADLVRTEKINAN